MPRATFKPGRLYTSEIVTLQRLLKFVTQDERLNAKERQHISATIDFLVTKLSNVSVGKLDNEI